VFTVVDAGAGPGTLARSVRAAAPTCNDALRYVAVEISPAQRERHPEGIESRADLPVDPVDGVVVANELLDNLPFRLVVFEQGWREAFVDVGRDGRFVEVLSAPFDPVPACLPATAPFGARAPLVDRAAALIGAARSLVRSGTVVAFDYGTPITAMLVNRPWREWLRTYRDHGRGEHYLSAPGTQDITIDVPIDQLPAPDAVRSQAQFLQRWGIDELVDEGRRIWSEQAARPGLEAMRMRSRISEAEALLDPDGLGSFLVAEWRTPAR
jgi:SAM-dependent MidA family methyltransferase